MTTVPIGQQLAGHRISAAQIRDLLGDWEDHGPLFRALATKLEVLIETERLPAGAVLPAERELAAAIAVSRNTVAAAYKRLSELGLSRSRRGSGTQVAPRRSRPGAPYKIDGLFSGVLTDNPPDIDLTMAAADCAPPVAEAIRKQGDIMDSVAGSWESSHGYFPAGLPSFRAAIADHYTKARGLPTEPNQVLVTTGAQQAIGVIFETIGRPGGAVVVEDTTFAGAIDLLHRHNLRPVTVPAGGVDIDRLDDVITTHAPSLVYISTSVHNPTGSRYPDSARNRLVEIVQKHPDVVFVDDTVMADLDLGMTVPDPHRHELAAQPNLILIGSMSKLFWGGLRVAWIRGGSSAISRFTTARTITDLGSPMTTQAVAQSLLTNHFAEVRTWRNAQLRRQAEALLDGLRKHLPEWEIADVRGGLSLWIKLPGIDGDDFARVALDEGVAVVPGRLMSPDDTARDHIRLSFVHSETVLAEAVTRLTKAWQTLNPA